MTFIIAVSNEKGGVAKTTTALSLGVALANQGKSILLMDLDPQASLTRACGFDPAELKQVVVNWLLKNDVLNKAILKTKIDNLRIVPTNHLLQEFQRITVGVTGPAARLRYAIRKAELHQYDFIIIDCPPSLGALTVNALVAANLLIIPTQPEFFSAYALRNMMLLIRRIRSGLNKELAYLILVTMLDRRNWVHQSFLRQLEKTYGKGLFKTVIEVDTKLRTNPELGNPITLYPSDSRGALQYCQLAEEVLEYVQETNRETRKPSFY